MRAFLSILFLAVLSSVSEGEIIFSAALRTAGPITLGDTALFDVSLSTNAATGTITNLGGVTFFAGADDPTGAGGITSGGIFTVGTNDPTSPLAGGRSYLFSTTEGGFLNSNDSTLVFSASGPNRTLSETKVFLGTLSLDTAGATLGDHTLSFSSLDAINASGDNLANLLGTTLQGIPLQYTITAVPEPGSIALVCLSAAAIAIRRSRRQLATRERVRSE
jgi:hypothetical protein